MLKQRVVIAGLGVVLLVLSAFVALPAVTPAQDTIEERVSGLETQVAEQQDRIDILEEQVEALDAQNEPSAQGSNPTPIANPPDEEAGTITLSGVGTTVSDKVVLPAGRYKVTATVEVQGDFEGFIVVAYVDDDEHYLFNELIDDSGTWTGSTILNAGNGGETFVEVSNTDSPWTLIFEPF